MGNVLDKLTEKIKTHILCYFQKSCPLWDNVGKCGRDRQDTHENRIRLKRITCWISKATDTHLEYVIFIVFHNTNGYANARHC